MQVTSVFWMSSFWFSNTVMITISRMSPMKKKCCLSLCLFSLLCVLYNSDAAKKRFPHIIIDDLASPSIIIMLSLLMSLSPLTFSFCYWLSYRLLRCLLVLPIFFKIWIDNSIEIFHHHPTLSCQLSLSLSLSYYILLRAHTKKHTPPCSLFYLSLSLLQTPCGLPVCVWVCV